MATSIHSRRRQIALMGIFALIFTALIGRMVFLQLVHGDWLRNQAFLYRMRPTPIQGDRGEILDRYGQPLLKNVVCESVYAQPPLIKDKPAAARVVAPLLGMDVAEVEKRMSRHSFFEWLKRKVKPDVARKVRALGVAGIGFAPEKCRYYPEGDLAVHALGISNIDHQGIEGLELTYNKHLAGKNGAVQCEYTARGLPMDGGECRVIEGQQGLTLQTTIDTGLQRLVAKETERAALETRARGVSMMVMQVGTGEILAIDQWPRYDPLLGGNSDPATRRIRIVADTLPPGSIFKPTTASAVLDSGVINENTVISDTGCIHVGGWPICNWDHKALGPVKIETVMAKSSNVGFATLGMWLGSNRFYEYHDRFGFTRTTGIDLPGEAVGSWIPKKRASEVDLAVQAYGQTLTVSPIQMLAAIGAIANDGKLMWPHLGKALLDADGNMVQRIEPRVVRQVVKPEVARLVQRLMVEVVESGTGRNAAVVGYKVGGKTGTATKVINGVVAKGKYIASFVGFAPYPNPEVVVLISVDEPQGAYYGGQIAAPIFGEVMGSVLAYLDAPKTKEPPRTPPPGYPAPPKPPEQAAVPLVVNLPLAEARKAAKAAGFEVTFEGAGAFVTAQHPLPGATAYKGGTIIANTALPAPGTERVTVPSLEGLTLQQAAQQLALKGLLMEAQGTGNIRRWEPAAGAFVPQGTVVKVVLEPPPRR